MTRRSKAPYDVGEPPASLDIGNFRIVHYIVLPYRQREPETINFFYRVYAHRTASNNTR